ncbi:MAG: N-acetyl-gamma-glutamyl-phosphate reductase [Dehalococcoidia bacterium]|nr:N-acetyl-gamma-glutamyl-phosphate reductase [Dehalococcoidia bacterium]
MKVGIIGVTGYSGSELARLLLRHPEAKLVAVTGRSAAGKRVPEVMPYLWDVDLPITESIEESVDIVFSALSSGASAVAIAPFVEKGVKAVDIAADFRLHDAAGFKRAYKIDHPAPHLLPKAVYGLSEIHKQAIKRTSLVANPGCYPAAAILALAPAVREGIIGDHVIVDGKSGISGAGRGGLTTNTMDLYAEANENVMAYGLDGHGHQPEIAQELAELREAPSAKVTFVPHRIPMTRGILATCYAPLVDGGITKKKVRALYREFYGGEPFVRVSELPPQTKHTLGTNYCLVYPTVDEQTGTLVVVSCLDNLVKGAAGQAIQNMNLMFGLPETMGLQGLALYP